MRAEWQTPIAGDGRNPPTKSNLPKNEKFKIEISQCTSKVHRICRVARASRWQVETRSRRGQRDPTRIGANFRLKPLSMLFPQQEMGLFRYIMYAHSSTRAGHVSAHSPTRETFFVSTPSFLLELGIWPGSEVCYWISVLYQCQPESDSWNHDLMNRIDIYEDIGFTIIYASKR